MGGEYGAIIPADIALFLDSEDVFVAKASIIGYLKVALCI